MLYQTLSERERTLYPKGTVMSSTSAPDIYLTESDIVLVFLHAYLYAYFSCTIPFKNALFACSSRGSTSYFNLAIARLKQQIA